MRAAQLPSAFRRRTRAAQTGSVDAAERANRLHRRTVPSMPKPNYDANFATLDVHLIPHSHTDPGWLSTYRDYYGREVRPILNAVITSFCTSGDNIGISRSIRKTVSTESVFHRALKNFQLRR